MSLGESILLGRRILVVEDEFFLADDLRQILRGQQAEVLGPVGTIANALKLISDDEAIDCVVLDVNLCGQVAYPISAALRRRRIPFVFTTGYGGGQIPAEFSTIVRLEKPVEPAALIAALEAILQPIRA